MTAFRVHIKDRTGYVYRTTMTYERLADLLTLVKSGRDIVGSIPNTMLAEVLINGEMVDCRIQVAGINVIAAK